LGSGRIAPSSLPKSCIELGLVPAASPEYSRRGTSQFISQAWFAPQFQSYFQGCGGGGGGGFFRNKSTKKNKPKKKKKKKNPTKKKKKQKKQKKTPKNKKKTLEEMMSLTCLASKTSPPSCFSDPALSHTSAAG